MCIRDRNIIDQIKKISVTESRVFISGPSGSGKELIARKIHKASLRSKKPFIVLNGALLDINKYELELFGEEKENGSISYGALEKANKGTLLIDQVSEIPLDIQSKILRVLTDQKFKRLNGNSDINVNVRIICSSSKDLKEEIPGFKGTKKRESYVHQESVAYSYRPLPSQEIKNEGLTAQEIACIEKGAQGRSNGEIVGTLGAAQVTPAVASVPIIGPVLSALAFGQARKQAGKAGEAIAKDWNDC